MDERRGRRGRLLALLAAAGLLAAACGGDEGGAEGGDTTTPAAGGEAAAGGTASFGIVEPAWIDSFNVQDSAGFQVARLLFDGLTDFDENLNAVPAVAESWTTDDNQVWTFTLRDDVTFHDGEPVTAQSFVDAWNRVANPDTLSDVSYYGSYVAGIEGWAEVEAGEATEITGVEAVDDTTLRVTLVAPNFLLPKALAHPVFSPVSVTAVEVGGDGYSDAPVGNGPYRMSGSWERNVGISVERFDGYHGDPGLLDRIDFRIYDAVETMYLDFQAGALDISDVPPEQLTAAASEYGERFVSIAIGAYNYLGFPNDIPPFDNPDIRRALSLAIDREAIADVVFSGARTPADGFAPSLAPGAVGGCEYTEYDPERAVELFEAAGGIPSGTVNVSFNSGGGHEEWLQAVANGWQQLFGIETSFNGQEFAPYIEFLQGGGIDGPFRLGWLWDVPHAENFLTPLFSSQSSDNFSGYDNPDFEAALEEFRTAEDEAAGEPAILEAQEILCEDMPVAPVTFTKADKVYSERVGGFVHSIFDFSYLEDVTVTE